MNQLEELLQKIASLNRPVGRPLLIGVSGFGGSLAEKLKQHFGNAEVVSSDDFITGRCAERTANWSSYDRPRLQRHVLEPVSRGKTAKYQIYNWGAAKLDAWRTVPKTEYLIIEGVSILHPDLRAYYDFAIWADCPLDIATQRGIKRDRDYGNNHDDQWLNIWMPNERDYFDKYRPDKRADFLFATS